MTEHRSLSALDEVIRSATSRTERAALIVQLAARLAEIGAGLAADEEAPRDDFADAALSVEEAARRLGVSTSWVYRNASKLPAVRVGRRLLFRSKGLDRFLQRGLR